MTRTEVYAVRGIVGLALGLFMLGGSAYGEDFSWHGRVAADKTVAVKGLNGRIRATGSTGGEVTVTATKHGTKGDPASVDVRLVEHADGVTICTVYPASASAPKSGSDCTVAGGRHWNDNDNDVRVDYEVSIPQGVRFKAHNVNGAIEVSGLTAAVEAHSVNGGLLLATAGTVSAKSVNGSIEVTVGSLGDGLHVATVNGGAKVVLPAAINARLDAKTVHGTIETDFPLPVEGHHVGRSVSGALGSGGPEISVQTVNGSLALRKSR